jgi:hypothetical protein
LATQGLKSPVHEAKAGHDQAKWPNRQSQAVNGSLVCSDSGATVKGNMRNAIVILAAALPAAVVFTAPTACTLVANVVPVITMDIQENGLEGDAVLTAVNGAVNAGTLVLDSPYDGHNSTLVVSSGALVNTGQIQANSGNGGQRFIYGNVVNQGVVGAGAGVNLWLLAQDATTTFSQVSGAISGAGNVVPVGVAVVYTGGTVSTGNLIAINASIDVASSVTDTGTITLRGHSSLVENAAGVTLDVLGTPWEGNAVLTVAAGAVNAGTLALDSFFGSYGSSIVTGSAGLLNTATGLLDVRVGGGGARALEGSLANHGSIHVAAGSQLDLVASAAQPVTLLQADGSIRADGNLIVQGGQLDFSGGAISGSFYVHNSSIDVAATVTATSTIGAIGNANVLLDNASASVSIVLHAGAFSEGAVLSTLPGASNAGTITLQASDDWNGLQAVLALGGSSFTNTATGQILVLPSAGRSTIQGALVNDGALTLQAYTLFNAPLSNQGMFTVSGASVLLPSDLSNQGTVTVAPDAVLEVDESYSGGLLTQSGGTIRADGLVQLDRGRLDFSGGTINGSGTFRVRDSVLDVGAGVSAASTIVAVDNGNVLVDNASAFCTIWVQGGGGYNWATLTAAPGATNAGTIRLESLSNSWGSFLDIQDSLLNTATGIIQANHGAGGMDSGCLINEGLVAVAADNPIQISGSFVEAGGQISGPASLFSVQLSETASPATPMTLVLTGNSTLLTDNLANTTLWAQGNGGGTAILNAADGVSNYGTIHLESLGSWGSQLIVGDVLENHGSIEAAGSVGSTITGDVDNFGSLSVAAGSLLDINSASPTGPTLMQLDGSIAATGQVLLEGGSFNFEAGTLSGNFVVRAAALFVSADVTAPATIQAIGWANTLVGNESSVVTIWVAGGLDNQGTLTAAPGAVNAGTIVLESAASGWGSYLNAPDTLLNTSTGLIAVTHGAGGGLRGFSGKLVNVGTVYVAADTSLVFSGSDSNGPTLIQDGGIIAADGQLVQQGGLFDFEGGAVTGSFFVDASQIYISAAVDQTSLIQVVNNGNVLLGNDSPVVTLWVQGNDGYNGGSLTAAPNASNAGTILLQSASDSAGSFLSAPSTLVNAPSGVIEVHGGGGAPGIAGTLVNYGTLTISGVASMNLDRLVNYGLVGIDAGGGGSDAQAGVDQLFTALTAAGTPGSAGSQSSGGQDSSAGSGGAAPAVMQIQVQQWINHGIIGINPNSQVELQGGGNATVPTLTQADGNLRVEGSLIVDGGRFDYTGGSIDGDFITRNAAVNVAAVTEATTIRVVGPNSVLLDNASDKVTLRVQGCDLGGGDAVLTTADSCTNLGSIVLESLQEPFMGHLVVHGHFSNSGQIEADIPASLLGQAGKPPIQAVIDAGWLDNAGGLADSTGLPVLPVYQNAVAAVDDGSDDPGTVALAQQAQVPGVNDGLVAVEGYGNPANSGDGLVNLLSNFGDVLLQSAKAPLGVGADLLDSVLGNVWRNVSSGAINQAVGLVQGLLDLPSLVSDGAKAIASIGSRLTDSLWGTGVYTPTLTSNYARELAQKQAEGQGTQFAKEAVLSAGTLGLYGLGKSFGAAYLQAYQTGDTSALERWAGAAAVDAVLFKDVAAEVVAESQAAQLTRMTSGVADEAAMSGSIGTALDTTTGLRAVGDAVDQAQLVTQVTTAAEEVSAELGVGDAAAARATAAEQLAAERVDAQGQVALNNQVVRADGSRPWGPCLDPVRADAVEAKLLGEAQSFSWQTNYTQIPEDSFFHVRSVISTEDLVLVSEKWQTESSISVAPTETQFYRSPLAAEAKIDVHPGDVMSYHSHPGINEVMASTDDLKAVIKSNTDMMIVSRRVDGGVAEMKYTVVEAQELLDLYNQGDLKGYFTRFEAKYRAEQLNTKGTVLEENMRKQGMIP